MENKKIIDLPFNNRNIYSLLRLVPGISPSTPNSESDFFTSTIRFSINGGKELLNDIQLDGVTAISSEGDRDISFRVRTAASIARQIGCGLALADRRRQHPHADWRRADVLQEFQPLANAAAR